MKINTERLIIRIMALTLAVIAMLNLAGCAVRNKNIKTEKVLVEKTDDETIWVDEESVTSEYTEQRVEITPAESDKISSEATDSKHEEDEEPELTQEQIEAPFKLKQSMYIRDLGVHKPIYQYEDAFQIDSGLMTYGISHNYDRDLVIKSINYYGLPNTLHDFWEKSAQHGIVSEWGWTFFLSTPDGLGQQTGQGGFNPIPNTRKAAIAQLKKWMITSYKLQNVLDVGFEANNGHYPWFHYAAEFGAHSVTAELGESISSPQSRIAFCRGAAKQYGIAWVCDFSYWYNNLNHGYTKVLADDKSEFYGHSHSLHERIFILGYLGGASYFMCEDAIGHNFWEYKFTKDGLYELTDTGKLVQKYYDFTKRESDVGVQYIPFGILMDHEHGSHSGDLRLTKEKAFQVFDYTEADYMNMDIMQKFFPDTNGLTDYNYYETKFLANSPYGESCDVILQNSSQKVLDSYPCLIMSGDLSDASVTERNRYTKYVKQGGILVMNTAYLDLFPDYKSKYDNSGKMEIKDEKGSVIIYGDDYDTSKLDAILADLEKRLMPFEIKGDVDYMINIKNGSMLVTVMNNKGVYKPNDREGWIDESATTDVTVTYNGNLAIKSVKEIYEQDKATLNGKSVTTSLTPGAIKIIEFNFG